MISSRALFISLVVALTACGGASSEVTASGPKPVDSPSSPSSLPKPATRLAEIAGAKVFDAHGAATACNPPRDACPANTPDRRFLDSCRLGGFQLRHCGCATLCSGDVSVSTRYFDATGKVSECAVATPDCSPPPASSAFQDACSERSHKLAVCGCEWLCSGDPTK